MVGRNLRGYVLKHGRAEMEGKAEVVAPIAAPSLRAPVTASLPERKTGIGPGTSAGSAGVDWILPGRCQGLELVVPRTVVAIGFRFLRHLQGNGCGFLLGGNDFSIFEFELENSVLVFRILHVKPPRSAVRALHRPHHQPPVSVASTTGKICPTLQYRRERRIKSRTGRVRLSARG